MPTTANVCYRVTKETEVEVKKVRIERVCRGKAFLFSYTSSNILEADTCHDLKFYRKKKSKEKEKKMGKRKWKASSETSIRKRNQKKKKKNNGQKFRQKTSFHLLKKEIFVFDLEKCLT